MSEEPEIFSIKNPELRLGVRAKFIERWAKLYVKKLIKEGKDKATDWGMTFFHKEDIPLIAEKAKELLKKEGLLSA